MRMIEREMMGAVLTGRDWRKGNTEVFHNESGAVVMLHGNHIATHRDCSLEVNKHTLAKWPTSVTKSRLKALGADVYTRNGVTYLNGEAI